MSKIKILHSCEIWLPQTMTWLHGQLSHLPQDKIENIIVAEKTAHVNQFPMPEIHSLDNEKKISRFVRKVLKKIDVKRNLDLLEITIKEKKPDILHSHFGTVGWYNCRLAEKYGVKHVVSFYGVDVNKIPSSYPWWRKRYKDLFETVDRISCEGPFMASQIEKLGCKSEKLKVQRLGIDLSKFPFKQRLFKKDDRIKFLMAGSFLEKKGFLDAIEAFRLFNKNYPNFSVTVIGDASKGRGSADYKEAMIRAINNYAIAEKFLFLGFQPYDRLITEAYNHDIFISPSVFAQNGDCEGGAPVALIEMAATGMPIISTKHCDIPFVLSPEYHKLLCAEKNPGGLVRSIEYFLNNDYSELMIKNRKFIENNLDLTNQSFIEGLMQNYYSLLV
jgi:colanic acid/amylovoran biosynthesis glycosyltransferase